MVFNTAQNVTNYLGYFFDSRKLSKIAQSGHTEADSPSAITEIRR